MSARKQFLIFVVFVLAIFSVGTLSFAQDDAAIPDRFNNPDDPVEIALVRFIGDGAFMARYLAGAESQAEELGVNITEYNARNDQAQFVTLLEQAIQQQPDAIIISHGTTDTVQPYIDQAEEAGIPVVTFDTVVNSNVVPEIEQDDLLIGFDLTRHVAITYGGNANVLYLNIAGFPPLDKRDRSYQNFLWRYPNFVQVAQVGVYVEGGTAAETQTRVEAALTENPDVNVVIAMWDELAKGAVRAIEQLDLADKIKVYSVDVSDENIQMMREEGSPWEATMATDPYSTARVAVRTAVARIGGETVPKYLLIEPTLITRETLIENNVTNMDELIVALPSLGESDLSWYPWIRALADRNAAG
ncbi:MAG: sugar ABC transporter substrate-binding protein [Anaerolineae bacterium]|nr:sugar ABC transporter substrate-binding protein [Anaerolineae bacterium]